ncbi:MAG TPA: bifunctional helix-turn-helix transcriptional regulator/GNAT family N-acetyltransferase [Puia sp.]|uniref:bifunctional helix-turn-helix transcriptional regulator/GNAT family N-acetyltransferase n=1 Tax=Puia sp. TaxID=2045100 RepID=UPI002CE97FB9|nr:bifunctional helix-turn-helix transcriptional regulator/GNAT family N-acetyltransferase [Puia sp.]HVU93989.1 bifunctional helix-turn-helix transcriptional regulator/GNAT family N-acetyltransferase [Puia sp.]
MKRKVIPRIRAFNRWYTDLIGLLDQHLLNSDWSLAEARLIYEIQAGQPVQASKLTGAMSIDKGYLSRLLKKLEKERIITKRKSPGDARAFLLSLTEKGMREFAVLNKASDEQVGQMLEPLSEVQQGELLGHMEAVNHLLGGPKGEVTIRTQLLPGDLGLVAWLHGSIYTRENEFGLGFEGYVLKGLGEFALEYDPAKDRVWVCEAEGRMVGFLLGMRREEGVAQLRYFILLPEYRGAGLGKRLMGLFMDWLRESGYRRAYLWTTHEQETAAALYLRHGFRLTEEKRTAGFGKMLTERRYDWAE